MSSAQSTMARELESLRRALTRIDRGRGRRYPARLQERVTRWAGGRRQEGARWHQLSSEIGISAESLRRWVSHEVAAVQPMVPVEVIGNAQEDGPPDRRLRMVTRAGHRIEGLSLADAIELVRVLG